MAYWHEPSEVAKKGATSPPVVFMNLVMGTRQRPRIFNNGGFSAQPCLSNTTTTLG
jgi:hypothetical protein